MLSRSTIFQTVNAMHDTNAAFKQRYFFDSSYYKPGGPAYLCLSGETSGPSRFDNLQTGSKEPSFRTSHYSLKLNPGSHPNFDASYKWPWSHAREPVSWRELSIQIEHNGRPDVSDDRTKSVVLTQFGARLTVRLHACSHR